MDRQVRFEAIEGELHEGFTDASASLACYTDHQIFERYQRYAVPRQYTQSQALSLSQLAELEVGELHLLERLARDEYAEETRMMMDVAVERGGKTIFSDTALNDTVITKGAVARVIQMNVLCDGADACDISGDGVIIATPTGSTAYSMAAGGPIVEPTARNMIITPICAHALQAKSIVLSSERTVTVRIGKIGRRNAYLSADGGKALRLEAGDLITVRVKNQGIRLIRLKNTSFYERINQKFRMR